MLYFYDGLKDARYGGWHERCSVWRSCGWVDFCTTGSCSIALDIVEATLARARRDLNPLCKSALSASEDCRLTRDWLALLNAKIAA